MRYPSIGQYKSIRIKLVAGYPVIDLKELGVDLIFSAEVAAYPFVQRLRYMSTDITYLCNDLFSVEKELYRNEVINIILATPATLARL
ncbi:MAG: terpene synthase family protein [Flavobacteriales bacterium]